MEFGYFIKELEANKGVFESLLKGIDGDLRTWKQHPEKWCLLEIICHLYDEEREDFRQRFRYLIESPKNDPPPINPQLWVEERKYMEQDYNGKLAAFLEERSDSISYLKSLATVPWDNRYQHKHFGPIGPRHYLHNWLAHDYLHIKQITRLKYDYVLQHSDQNMTYAGEWK